MGTSCYLSYVQISGDLKSLRVFLRNVLNGFFLV